jgi:hypothetical protein
MRMKLACVQATVKKGPAAMQINQSPLGKLLIGA